MTICLLRAAAWYALHFYSSDCSRADLLFTNLSGLSLATLQITEVPTNSHSRCMLLVVVIVIMVTNSWFTLAST